MDDQPLSLPQCDQGADCPVILEKRDSAFAHLRKIARFEKRDTGDRRPPVDVGAFNQELPGETPQDSDD